MVSKPQHLSAVEHPVFGAGLRVFARGDGRGGGRTLGREGEKKSTQCQLNIFRGLEYKKDGFVEAWG